MRKHEKISFLSSRMGLYSSRETGALSDKFNPKSNWTDERVSTLRRCWALGWPASTIAFKLNRDEEKIGGDKRVTRNAVIGKANRLHLLPRKIVERDR